MRNIKDSVEIIDLIKPIYNFKASEKPRYGKEKEEAFIIR